MVVAHVILDPSATTKIVRATLAVYISQCVMISFLMGMYLPHIACMTLRYLAKKLPYQRHVR